MSAERASNPFVPGHGGFAEILSFRDQLALVGYVWKPPGTRPRWEAGIPSLMRYVCR